MRGMVGGAALLDPSPPGIVLLVFPVSVCYPWMGARGQSRTA